MKSIYYRQPYQQIFIERVKNRFTHSVNVLLSPDAGRLAQVKALIELARIIPEINGLPEPVLDNTRKKSSHIIIGIRDRFFRRLVLPSRHNILLAMVNGAIMVNETDLYGQFIDWWVWEIKRSDWPPLGPMQPDPHRFRCE